MNIILEKFLNELQMKLETSVLPSSTDEKSVNSIVESFYTVWDLSLKYPALKNVIRSDIFHKIENIFNILECCHAEYLNGKTSTLSPVPCVTADEETSSLSFISAANKVATLFSKVLIPSCSEVTALSTEFDNTSLSYNNDGTNEKDFISTPSSCDHSAGEVPVVSEEITSNVTSEQITDSSDEKIAVSSSELDNITGLGMSDFSEEVSAPSTDFLPPNNVAERLSIEEAGTSEAYDPDIEYLCGLCDEQIEMFNSDLKFSLDMHLQSRRHKEVIKNFSDIFTNSASSVSSDIIDGEKNANNHLPIRLTNSSSVPTISVKDKVNKTCVIKKNGQYYCILCESQLPASDSYDSHFVKNFHKGRVQKQLKFINRRTRFAVGVIFNDIGFQHCTLCDAFLKCDSTFIAHVSSKKHRQQLKEAGLHEGMITNTETVLPSIKNQSFILISDRNRAGIILWGWERIFSFCILCNHSLRNEQDQLSHVKIASHITQFNRFVTRQGKKTFSVSKKNLRILAPRVDINLMVSKGLLFCGKCKVWLENQIQLDAHIHSGLHLKF